MVALGQLISILLFRQVHGCALLVVDLVDLFSLNFSKWQESFFFFNVVALIQLTLLSPNFMSYMCALSLVDLVDLLSLNFIPMPQSCLIHL